MIKIVVSLLLAGSLVADEPINYKLRGQKHSVTGVEYNRLGFPMFDSSFNCRLPLHLINASDNKQFRYCSNKLREEIKKNPSLKEQFTKKQLKMINSKSPNIDKFTWHHHQSKSKRTLQLVDRDIHNKTAHSGGRSIYGGGAEARKAKKIKISQINRRATTKIMSSGIKFASKGMRMAKVGLMSAASAVPFVGAVAQVALDIYMANEISNLADETQNNSKNIQKLDEISSENRNLIVENRDYISRLEEEQNILGTKVDENYQNIDQLFKNIYNLDNDIATIFTEISNMNSLISENSQEIKNIKNGIYLAGIEQLNNYFDSKKADRDSLNNAINDLIIKSNVDNLNNDTDSLLLNYLNIAYIEKALIYKKENRNITFFTDKILKNFDNLIEKDNIKVITNAYSSMQEIFIDDQNILDDLTSKFKKVSKKHIDNLITQYKFEDAISLAKTYMVFTNDSELYDIANTQREQNFKQFKDKLSIKNIDTILNTNQNNLLNKEALIVVYNYDNYDKMLDILKTKKFDDVDFKTKGYYLLFKQIDTNKANQLKSLIVSNDSYSQELKNYIKGEQD